MPLIAALTCPSGWTGYHEDKNRCFKLHSTQSSYDNARDRCERSDYAALTVCSDCDPVGLVRMAVLETESLRKFISANLSLQTDTKYWVGLRRSANSNFTWYNLNEQLESGVQVEGDSVDTDEACGQVSKAENNGLSVHAATCSSTPPGYLCELWINAPEVSLPTVSTNILEDLASFDCLQRDVYGNCDTTPEGMVNSINELTGSAIGSMALPDILKAQKSLSIAISSYSGQVTADTLTAWSSSVNMIGRSLNNLQNTLPSDVAKNVMTILNYTSSMLNGTFSDTWKQVQKTKPGTTDIVENLESSLMKTTQLLEKPDAVLTVTPNTAALLIKAHVKTDTPLRSTVEWPDITAKYKIQDQWKKPVKDKVEFSSEYINFGTQEKVHIVGIIYDSYDDMATTSHDFAIENKKNAKDLVINSNVIALKVDRPLASNAMVNITFAHKTNLSDTLKGNLYCAWLDFAKTNSRGVKGVWSTDGCRLMSNSLTETHCQCDHMTNFAVLMQPVELSIPEEIDDMLTYLTYAGLGLSILSLLVFCVIIIYHKSLHIERYLIHLNLALAMLIANITFLTNDFLKHDTVACTARAVALHYFYLAFFCWLAIESVYLFSAFTSGVLTGRLKCYIPLGWGIPLIIVTITTVIPTTDPDTGQELMGLDFYGTIEDCWISLEKGFRWAFLVPVCGIIGLNLLVLLILICNLHKPAIKRVDILGELKCMFRNGILLTLVCSLSWLLGILAVESSSAVAFQVSFVALNSLQGFFIFLLHGLGSPKFRNCVCPSEKKRFDSNTTSITELPPLKKELRYGEAGLVPTKPQPTFKQGPALYIP